VGWFKRDGGRRTGRHGYGVPDVTARRLAATGTLTAGRTALLEPPAPEAAAPLPPPPARLPDDRTPEQIGDKVADVLWSYYAQQGTTGTPLASPTAAAPAYDDSYDDAYDAALFAPGTHFATAQQELVQPPAAATVVTPAVAAPPRFRVYERPRPVAAAAAPLVPERRVAPDRRVVQLGFVDGSTLELLADDPAAKALRSAAAGLTLRA
jgi:hypothetical protein